MADNAHAAGAADQQIDIIGHILDSNKLDVPFINAQNYLDGSIQLPEFPPFQVFGLTIDMSITRHVVMMWLASALLIGLLLSAFRRPRLVPGGLANFFEAIVVFLRDEVITPIMGEDGRRYLPYLLTVFFFILFCNLLGLIPYSATATGNISVTAGLALCTFVLTQAAGIANNGFFGYCKSLVPGGIPWWLLPIMIPVELVSLFANMFAGHMVILVFLGLIIMLKSYLIAPFSVAFAVAIYMLEIFVSAVQAFIFTLLSALFISMAAHPDH